MAGSGCARIYTTQGFWSGHAHRSQTQAGSEGRIALTFATVRDPILPMDVSITGWRCETVKGAENGGGFMAWEPKQPEEKLRTMGARA